MSTLAVQAVFVFLLSYHFVRALIAVAVELVSSIRSRKIEKRRSVPPLPSGRPSLSKE